MAEQGAHRLVRASPVASERAVADSRSTPAHSPYHHTPDGRNWNVTHIHHAVVPLPPSIALLNVTALRLPPARDVGQNRLHVFALSLALPDPRSTAQLALRIRSAQMTSRWTELPDGRKAQSLVLALENAASASLVPHSQAWLRSNLSVSVDGLPAGFEVVRAGKAGRLMPGDGRDVEVLVAPSAGGHSDTTSDQNEWDGEVRVTGTLADSKHIDLGRATVKGPLVRDWAAFYLDPAVSRAQFLYQPMYRL